MREEVESNAHRIFKSGTRKEQAQLKQMPKYGPIKKWPAGKVSAAAEKVSVIKKWPVVPSGKFWSAGKIRNG
jgi:hypothetical protein